MSVPVRVAAVIAACVLTTTAGCGAAERSAAPEATASDPAVASPAATAGADSDAGTGGDTTVTIDADDVQLAGDLRLPAGPGPHPAVVLVHGSGPVDRDGATPGQLGMGFPQPVTVLADVAAGLRAAGYAVLTYDKRTCGPFNGCADNDYPRPADDLTVDVFAADALAAAAHLRARDDIATDAVSMVGHSQGATLVPAMLLDDPQLAAGAMLAAPHAPIDAVLAQQADTLADLVEGLDAPPPGADQQVAQVRDLARQVRALRQGGAASGGPIGGASPAFWRSWLRVSDGVPALAAQAPQPVLVVLGGADTNVTAGDAARWRRSLDAGDDGRDEVVVLDCVSHALNCLGTDDPAAVDVAGIAPGVDPRVVDALVAFLDGAVR